MSVRESLGMVCPRCGEDNALRVYMHTWAPLTADGTDANDNEHIWDDEDECLCECGFTGVNAGVILQRRAGEILHHG